MTLCRSWPLYGLLALALVVRATCADDCPAKTGKAAECCKEKQAKQCAEKCCFEEMIRGLVQLGQMCDSSCSSDDDDAECQKCPESCSRQIAVGISLSKLGPIPFLVPSISVNYRDARDAAACTPCQPVAEPKQYRVQTKVMRQKGKSPEVLCCPAITVPAGQSASCCTSQGGIEIEIKKVESGFAQVGFAISQVPEVIQPCKAGGMVRMAISKAEARLPLGKTVKLPLNPAVDTCHGKAWLEVEVNSVSDVECAPPCRDAERTQASCAVDRAAPPQFHCVSVSGVECVPPPAVALHNQEMFYVLAFRSPKGELIVEPPPTCPMPVVPPQMTAHMRVAGGNYPTMHVAPAISHPVPEVLLAPVITPCTAATPAHRESKGAVIRAANGKACLEVECGADCTMSFSEMTLKMAGCTPCMLRVSGEQVAISTPFVTATADRVIADMGRDYIELEGNVKLNYHAKGREGVTCADKACIRLTEKNMTINLQVSEKSSE